jgi:hypothetical protein
MLHETLSPVYLIVLSSIWQTSRLFVSFSSVSIGFAFVSMSLIFVVDVIHVRIVGPIGRHGSTPSGR